MENRNLFRIYDTVRRQKLLKHGRLPVVSFISEMPRTKHFLDTFTMDIALATVNYDVEWLKLYNNGLYIIMLNIKQKKLIYVVIYFLFIYSK